MSRGSGRRRCSASPQSQRPRTMVIARRYGSGRRRMKVAVSISQRPDPGRTVASASGGDARGVCILTGSSARLGNFLSESLQVARRVDSCPKTEYFPVVVPRSVVAQNTSVVSRQREMKVGGHAVSIHATAVRSFASIASSTFYERR